MTCFQLRTPFTTSKDFLQALLVSGSTSWTNKKKKGRRNVKTYTLTGIILIVIGIVAFAYQGITYTTREKVVDLGPMHMTADRTRTLPLPPIVGAIALVGGIVLLVVGSKKG
ncbi:MAG: hypothetical protein Q7J31_14100 [Syntrophales bacterium]|nr:hypothetical protein [Syntrophales bacterium]